MSEPLLENRDYTVIVAKTAPSVVLTPPGFRDRWAAAHDAVIFDIVNTRILEEIQTGCLTDFLLDIIRG